MPLDSLPGEIVVPTRDALIEKAKRDTRVRVPALDAADPQLDVDARVLVDQLLPVYAASKVIGENAVLEAATGAKAVAQHGEREGITGPNPATGGSGSVSIVASAGGTALLANDELIHEPTNTKYRVTQSGTYFDTDPCPIVGIATGPLTNLKPGSVLKWVTGRPGCGQTATVVEQTDGTGLSGGRLAETPIEFRDRIRASKKEKAASGNDADYQETTSETPDLGIQQVFTIPCILGPGTTAVTFTVHPSRPGGSRIPNATQVAAAEQFVVGEMPADDGPFYCPMVEESVDVAYRVTWDNDAVGWTDLVPWPPYYQLLSGTPRAIIVNGTGNATNFQLKTANSVYTGVAQPQVGQTIAFFDAENGKFIKKRILSFTGTGPWTITVDTSNGVSDAVYIPVHAQRAMPWSESMPDMLPKLFEYFDKLGPGEQVASFYDQGRRQRRQPEAPKEWPHTLTSKGLEQALDIDAITDGSVVEGDGVAPTVGSPGAFSNILQLQYVSVFPE